MVKYISEYLRNRKLNADEKSTVRQIIHKKQKTMLSFKPLISRTGVYVSTQPQLLLQNIRIITSCSGSDVSLIFCHETE